MHLITAQRHVRAVCNLGRLRRNRYEAWRTNVYDNGISNAGEGCSAAQGIDWVALDGGNGQLHKQINIQLMTCMEELQHLDHSLLSMQELNGLSIITPCLMNAGAIFSTPSSGEAQRHFIECGSVRVGPAAVHLLRRLCRYQGAIIGCELQLSSDAGLLQGLLEGWNDLFGKRPQRSIQYGCILPFQQPELADLMAESDVDISPSGCAEASESMSPRTERCRGVHLRLSCSQIFQMHQVGFKATHDTSPELLPPVLMHSDT